MNWKRILSLIAIFVLSLMSTALAQEFVENNPVAHVATFIAVGTFWFWVLVALETILLFAFTENECGVAATISLVIFGAILQWGSGIDIIGYVMSNPWSIVGILGAYVGFGILWSGFRFYIYYSKAIQKIADGKTQWMDNENRFNNKNYTPEALKERWNKHVDNSAPSMIACRDKIVRWIAYWPISLIWFMISDFMTEIFNRVYLWLSSVYEGIAKRIRDRIKEQV